MTPEPSETPAPASPDEPEPPDGEPLSPRRLHPAGALLAVLDNVRDALVSIVVLLVLGSQSGNLGPVAALLAVGGAIAAAAVGYARWRAETYEIADGAIRHRRGVISPDETVVPLSRVHSIDSGQGPIQRLFGVHELHVQTAGGGEKGEVVLRAVDEGEERRLRAAAGLPDPVATDLPAWRLSTRGLLLVGLTAPQLGMLVPLLGGAAALLDDLLSDSARDTLIDRAPTGAAGIALLVVAVVAAAWLISFLGSIVAFAGFSVVRDGDRLRIRRGLLQRRATSAPLQRIHAVSIAEGPLRRPFGLCSVRLETTGYGKEPAAARTLFPLLRVDAVAEQLRHLVPALAAEPQALERPPTRARRRYVLPEALAGLAVATIATAIWTPAWPAIPTLTLLFALDGLIRYRNAGWRLTPTTIALRRGSLTRRTLLANPTRLQDHSLAQTPLQHRAALADVSITVASGTNATVSDLDATTATTLFTRLRPTS
jgi:putative membrane protein